MRVMIATDGSAHGREALLEAVRMVRNQDGNTREVDLVCVVPGADRDRHQGRHLTQRATKRLDSLAASLAGDGMQVHPVIQSGSPTRTLIATSAGYDIAVVAAQSHQGDDVSGLGPVASRLAEHGRCPTLLARSNGGDSAARILIPVDGSDRVLEALSSLGDLLDLGDSEITLLHIVEVPWIAEELDENRDQDWIEEEDHEGPADVTEPEAQLEREIESEADGILAAAARRLPGHLGVTRVVKRGLPANEVLSEAETGEYDLIVLSASGGDDLKHQILGSVSSRVAWNAPCSVLLMRPINREI